MKKFRNFVAEEMSVTLKQHGSTSYKVHAVGSKMKAHGGLKVGETVHDHHIDDLRDSGIKVRYHKEEVTNEAIERKADSKMIMVKDPNTGKTVLRRAPRKEIEIGKGKMESVEVNELSSKTMKNYIRKAASPVDKRSVGNQASKGAYKLATSDDMDAGEKEDRKSFNRGRGIQRAAKKLYSRTSEETVNELSNDLVNKVAKKRAIKVGSSMMKADGDRRDPEYQKAMAKKKANDSLRFSRGARKMGEDYSDKEVRMGKGVAFDKRYKGGNMTGAYKTINKIKKGLGDHPKVRDALRRANEEFNKGE